MKEQGHFQGFFVFAGDWPLFEKEAVRTRGGEKELTEILTGKVKLLVSLMQGQFISCEQHS